MKPQTRWPLIIPLYLALNAIYSYGLSYAGIPLNKITYLVFNLGFGLGLAYIWWRHRRKDGAANVTSNLVIFIPCLIQFLILFLGFRGYITPPNNHDIPNHYFMITRILQTQTVKYPVIFADYVPQSWYMFGFHALAANYLYLSNTIEINAVIFPLVWALVSLYPMAVYYFAAATTKNQSLSLIAAVVSTTFFMFPICVLGWGGWTLSMGIPILFFALGHFYRYMESRSWPDFLIVALLLIGLFFIHTTELFWFGALAAPMIFTRFKRQNSRIRWPAIAAVFLVVGLLMLPLFREGLGRMNGPGNESSFSHGAIGEVITAWWMMQVGTNGNLILTLTGIYGLYIWFKRKLALPIMGGGAVLMTAWWLRMATPLTDPLNRRFFPLFEADRIYALIGPYFSLLAAAGILLMAKRWVGPKRRLKATRRVAACLLVMGCAWPWLRNVSILRLYLAIDTTVTQDDISLIRRNQEKCPTYLNDDYADAGRWIPFFSSSRVLLNGPTEILKDKDEKLAYLTDVCRNPQPVPYTCIYVGGKDTRKARKVMNAQNLLTDPRLTLVDRQGKSFIFKPNCPPDTRIPNSR